ncbi:MAG TPA: tail fiber protein [Pyrinomonadaceae bacterium]|jgi:microcystin-dependent protein
MSTPFLGEIKIIAWNYPPKGWAFCNGQFLPINQNQALFSLLGTMYGGNGQTTFALPDFRGKVPMHVDTSPSHTQGETAGQYAHTLTISEMPAHNHFMQVTDNVGSTQNPSGSVILSKSVANTFGGFTNVEAMNAGSITNTGGSQPHENKQPFLVLNFIIALQGIFPSRN